MAESNEIPEDKVLSEDDPLDINELASLNEEISDEFIEQLQNKIFASANIKNDGDLFEEVAEKNPADSTVFNEDLDDNFIKKYKAKLKKGTERNTDDSSEPDSVPKEPEIAQFAELNNEPIPSAEPEEPVKANENAEIAQAVPESEVAVPNVDLAETPPLKEKTNTSGSSIESVTGGNITEKPLTKETAAYNESLDYLDGNIKYSKYVVYIDPENKDFIESLTVKERKNLINRIIKEQDSISVTKRRLNKMQAVLTHTIVAILTVTIAIPCIYWAINASLEATINSYRSSQNVFSQLYKENGKINKK